MANAIKSRARHLLSGYSFVLFGAAILILLSVYYSPPFSIQEISTLVVSKSVLAGELGNNNLIDLIKSSGFIVSPVPILVSMFFELLLPHSFTLAKIPNILVLLSVYILYKKYFIEDFARVSSKLIGLTFLFLLVTSPWLIQIAIYNPSNLIALIFFVFSAVYLKRAFLGKASQDKDKSFFFASLILLSLSSIQGLLASFVMFLASSILFFKTNRVRTKNILLPFLAAFVFIFGNFLINKNTIYDQFSQGSIFTKISLSRLAQDIDERQKIDYLSSNKNFILPPPVRKFTYNKLALATDRMIRKSISLVDFEHFASPNESYDIIKLSGILPKGNLPLYYIWELPLIAYGAFHLLRKKSKERVWLAVVLLASLVPAIIFEKRDFSQYGIFAHASLFILTIYGLTEIAKRLNVSKLTSKVIFFSLIFLVLLNYLNFLNLVYKKQSDYLKSNTLQYQQISDWIRKSSGLDQEIIITNRFGPTQLAVPAYLDLSFNGYWKNYDPVTTTNQNLTFTSFDLKSEVPKSGKVYIGFPGEFVGPSKNHEVSMLPESFGLIDVLKSSDESVYQFGRDLWVVESK